MKFTMVHNNFNVRDLDKSIKFYEDALGLNRVVALSRLTVLLKSYIWKTAAVIISWN